MQSKLVSFINVLRANEVRISPAETLDAMGVLKLLGYSNRQVLRDGLSLSLAKTADEKLIFNTCFDKFFQYKMPNIAANDAETAAELNRMGGDAQYLADADAALEQALQDSDSDAAPTLDLQGEMADDDKLREQLDTALMAMLQGNDSAGLAVAIARAAERAGLENIQMFTQKGQFTRRILDQLGEQHIRQAIVDLENRQSPAMAELQYYRDALREQVRDYVEREYLLRAEGRNKQFMDEILSKTKLNNIEHHYLHKVHALVRKMAKKLASRHSRKRRVRKRGQLNMSKTIRGGIATDGVMFNTFWKSTKKERPQILAVCDVSGSVSAYAKFLLMFLYSLTDVLPRVRSFAFSSHLGEVTEMFEQYPVEKAIEMVNWKYGGATDYGNSLLDFANLAMDDINKQTTVIILGDARNNNGDPKLEIMQSIYARAKQVIWLNPESRKMWGTGDSEMRRYQSACHLTAECNSLAQLERIIDQLLRSTSR